MSTATAAVVERLAQDGWDRAQLRYVAAHLERLPWRFRGPMDRRLCTLYDAPAPGSRVRALNLEIRRVVRRIESRKVRGAADDADICARAAAIAGECDEISWRWPDPTDAWVFCAQVLADAGLSPPAPDDTQVGRQAARLRAPAQALARVQEALPAARRAVEYHAELWMCAGPGHRRAARTQLTAATRTLRQLHRDERRHADEVARMDAALQAAGSTREAELRGAHHTATTACVKRMADPVWVRRQLRVMHGREIEGLGRDLGLIGRRQGAGLYCSDEALHRRRGQKVRNRRLLEEMVAVNELDQEFTLAALADLSVSNPELRRAELMTRLAGFEQIAEARGHAADFWTLTCPSRFHRWTSVGGVVRDNPRWDAAAELTPRDAQQYLCRVWARIRAKLQRAGVELYGFRVAEPHHDGTPHWHLVVFLDSERVAEAREIVRHHALADSGAEPGAARRRVEFLRIDRSRGSAAGYLAKYITKNIDGYRLDTGSYGEPAASGAQRVDAWASTWGIRQFAQIGGPSVGVWRELRRVNGKAPAPIEAARFAADAGDWAAYVQAMGGPTLPRDRRPLRPRRSGDVDPDTGRLRLDRYGEWAAPRVVGVETIAGDVGVLTRLHRWRIERRGSAQPAPAQAGAAPWSPVTNCTRGGPAPEPSPPPTGSEQAAPGPADGGSG